MRRGTSTRLAGLQLADILWRNWGILLVRGIIAIGFGVLVQLLFRGWLKDLILPFGAYVLVDGILAVGIAIGERAMLWHWWVLFSWGLSGVLVGILTFFVPPTSGLRFMIYIAAWACSTGILEVMTAILLRGRLGGGWLLVLVGVISIAAGTLLLGFAGAGARVLARLITGFAVTAGFLLAILGLRARTTAMPPA